jgi:hypothetical protein
MNNVIKIGLLVLLITALGFTPILRSIYLYLAVALYSLFVIFQYSVSECFRRNISLIINAGAFILMVLFYKILHISTASNISIFQDILFFIPILLMPLFVESFSNQKQLNWMIGLILVIVSINIADNIRLCILHPELLVYVNRNILTDEMEGIGNIGASVWYNGIYFFFTICFFAFLNIESIVMKRAMLACSILTAVFILFFCAKASIIIFFILSVILLLYTKRTKSFTNLVLISLYFLIFVLLFQDLLVDSIINMLKSMISSERVLSRIILLLDADSSIASEGEDTLSARAMLWMESVNTWLANPVNFLFGIGAPPVSNAHMGVGQHSSFFDSFAKYGLIGGFFIFNSLRLSYKYILSLYDNDSNERLQIFVIAMLFMFFCITKGVFTPAIGSMLFLMLPLLSNQILNKSNSQMY